MCPVSSRGSPKGRVINTADDARTLLAESVIPVQAEGGLRRKAGLTRPQLCKRGLGSSLRILFSKHVFFNSPRFPSVQVVHRILRERRTIHIQIDILIVYKIHFKITSSLPFTFHSEKSFRLWKDQSDNVEEHEIPYTPVFESFKFEERDGKLCELRAESRNASACR